MEICIDTLKSFDTYYQSVQSGLNNGKVVTATLIEVIFSSKKKIQLGYRVYNHTYSRLLDLLVPVWKTVDKNVMNKLIKLLITNEYANIMYNDDISVIQYLHKHNIKFNQENFDVWLTSGYFLVTDFALLTNTFKISPSQFLYICQHYNVNLINTKSTPELNSFKNKMVSTYPDLFDNFYDIAKYHVGELIVLVSSYLSKCTLKLNISDLYMMFHTHIVEKMLWLRCIFNSPEPKSPTINDMNDFIKGCKSGIPSDIVPADVLESMILYKIKPDFESVLNIKYVRYSLHTIIQLFIEAGLPINYKTIGCILQANDYIDDIRKYNLEYNEQLYHSCFIANHYPEVYYNEFIKNPLLKFRLMFKQITEFSPSKTLLFGLKHNLFIDRYCIDCMVRNGNVGVIKNTLATFNKHFTIVPTPVALRYNDINNYDLDSQDKYFANLRNNLIDSMITVEYMSEPVFVELDLLM